MQTARTKQPKQANHDQVDGYDIVQQSRHHQNKNAGNQCNQGCDTQRHVHGRLLVIQGYADNISLETVHHTTAWQQAMQRKPPMYLINIEFMNPALPVIPAKANDE